MKYLLLIIFLGLITLVTINDEKNGSENNNSQKCSIPLTYQIAEIDPRFGVDKEEVKKALVQASDLWSQVIGDTVAVFSENGEIKVHLVYDHRQRLTDEEVEFRKRIEMHEKEINLLEKHHNQVKSNYNRMQDSLRKLENKYESNLNSFNEWVEKKNEVGAFSEKEITEYNARKEVIEKLEESVNQLGSELNNLGNELNRKAEKLNSEVQINNILVDKYNEKFSGEKHFIQGTYEEINGNKTINIYHFKNSNSLKLVLAHEIGHALHIDHVENSNSVMFDHTKDQDKTKLVLTDQDKEAILAVCGKK